MLVFCTPLVHYPTAMNSGDSILKIRLKYLALKALRILDPFYIVSEVKHLHARLVFSIEQKLREYEARIVVEEILSKPEGFIQLKYATTDSVLRILEKEYKFTRIRDEDLGIGFSTTIARQDKCVQLVYKDKGIIYEYVDWYKCSRVSESSGDSGDLSGYDSIEDEDDVVEYVRRILRDIKNDAIGVNGAGRGNGGKSKLGTPYASDKEDYDYYDELYGTN